MVSQETAGLIWHCYREIEASEKLIQDTQEVIENNVKRNCKDIFGRELGLQLGVPSGENSRRLLDVSPTLGLSVIRAHIANKQAELIALNEKAHIESQYVPMPGTFGQKPMEGE